MTLVDILPEGSEDDLSIVRSTSEKQRDASLVEGNDAEKKDDRATMPEHAYLYAPITRIDEDKWEVEGIATSEALDSYGTIFAYDASKRAFQAWIDRTANVREMHDRKAVGKGVGIFFDDANKQVVVRSRVSRGARDTWTKIQEGVLSGYSVGATSPTWDKVERGGKSYPYLVDYTLAELSFVDNASNPDGHGLNLCRADGLDTEVVDVVSEPETVVAVSEPDLERAGAKISGDTRKDLHDSRDHQLNGAKKTMAMCGCPECQDKSKQMDATPAQNDDTERLAERIIEHIGTRLQPTVQRMNAIAGQLARVQQSEIDITPLSTGLEKIIERLNGVPTNSSFDEVRASLEAVKGQVDRIAAQPAPGGPILNGARPVDKTLSTDRPTYAQPQEATIDVLNRMQSMGLLDTIDKQVAAAALAAQPVRGRTQ